MSTAPPPVKPLPPPPFKVPPPAGNGSPRRTFDVGSGVIAANEKVVVYGPGGSGKSKLCSLIAQAGIRPLFLDIEFGTRRLNVQRIEPLTFNEVRDALHDDGLMGKFDAVVIDSLTKLEELATQHVLATIKAKGDRTCKHINEYGFGDGQGYVYDAFNLVLGDLDSLHRKGKFILCTAHDCTAKVPNPSGEDFIRYEPRLQAPQGGKASIRHKVKEWCDHLLFVGYDVHVDEKNGKAQGGGTRTIYSQEMPTHWAKSRCLAEPIIYTDNSAEVWKRLFNKE